MYTKVQTSFAAEPVPAPLWRIWHKKQTVWPKWAPQQTMAAQGRVWPIEDKYFKGETLTSSGS